MREPERTDPTGPSWPDDDATRRSRRALAWFARLVPGHRRRDWLREWEAELWQLRTDRGATVRLMAFLTGALWHGTWERKEEWRMDTVLNDVRYAVRTLRRSPGFAFTAVALLAAGIGGSTALFSVLQASLLAPPPYPAADRLVVVDQLSGRPDEPMVPRTWSYPLFDAVRTEFTSLDQVAGYTDRTVTLTEMGDATLLTLEAVSPSYFQLLGVQPALGRTFGPDEEDGGAPDLVAVVSAAFWRGRMGARPDVVGGVITLDRHRLTVVGVAPDGFDGLTGGADVWVPLSAMRTLGDDSFLDDAWNPYFFVVGRLAPSADVERARAEAARFGATLTERFPPPAAASELTFGTTVVPFAEARVNPLARTSVLALFGAVALMLLAATANLAALLLARGSSRRLEAALRVSLGAGRSRLLRQLLTESVLLALLGGLVGVAVARGALDVLGRWLALAVGSEGGRGLEFLDPQALTLSWPVLLFALALTGGVGVVLGLLPAWQAAGTDPGAALRGGRGEGRGARRGDVSARSSLIVVQVGLALVLVTGATLTLRSVARQDAVALGFDPADLYTATYTLTAADRDAGVDPVVFHLALLDRIRALPGVVDATLGEVPLGGPTFRTIVMGSEGRPDLTPQMHTWIRYEPVPGGSLTMLGAEFLEGRDIADADDEGSEPVVVLNRTAAETLFPAGGAVGRTISLPIPGYAGRDTRVVGVVEDLRYGAPGAPAELQGFLGIRQSRQLATGVMVRFEGDPEALGTAVRQALADLNPNVPLTSSMTLSARMAGVTARPRAVGLLLSVFAAVALFLVAAGLYGVIAFSVTQRTRELGVRASLGAPRGSLMALVIRHGLAVAATGIAVGWLGAAWLTPFLGALLYDVEPLDPATFAFAAALLLAVSTVASYLPARRATSIDPMTALRSE